MRTCTYLIDPTDLGRGGSDGRSVTLCERALLALCWKYSSLENCGLAGLFSSGLGVIGLVGTGFEFALANVSIKLYTTAFSEKRNCVLKLVGKQLSNFYEKLPCASRSVIAHLAVRSLAARQLKKSQETSRS